MTEEIETDPVTGREQKKIKWRDGEINGTHLKGYWNDLPYSFEETVARLITVSGQKPYATGEGLLGGHKCSFDFHGTYEGKVFTLYDWKGSYDFHIGGRTHIDIEELKQVLTEEIADAEPTPYEAEADYEGPKILEDGSVNEEFISHQWP